MMRSVVLVLRLLPRRPGASRLVAAVEPGLPAAAQPRHYLSLRTAAPDLTYRVSGDPRTCFSLLFSTQESFSGFLDTARDMKNIHTFDDKGLAVGPNGEFEMIFSAKRPAGYTGNWATITPAPTP